MDKRRGLLIGGSFPKNYIFKKGLGFRKGLGLRKDVKWGKSTQKGVTVSVTKERIYLAGLRTDEGYEYNSTIYIGNKIEYDSSNRLLSNPIINEGYKKLFVHFNADSSNTRPAYIGLINCSKLPNQYMTNEQNGNSYNSVKPTNTEYFLIGNSIHKFLGASYVDGEYTLEFDISNISEIMLNFWSGDHELTTLTIYNIWME